VRHRVAAVLSILLAVIAVAVSFVAGSQASFNGQDANPADKWAFTALYAPSGLTATPSGHNVSLAWTAGTNGSGYSILGINNGTSSNCSAVTYASVGTSATTSYTDTGRYTPQGTYFCYQAKTTYGSSWTSVNSNPTAVAQLGVVASTVTITNGGTANQIGPGDVMTITFNQAITTSTGPVSGTNSVCWTSTGVVVLGTVAISGSCSATESNLLGKLSGGTTSTFGRYNATYVWSNGNKTVTVTIGSTKQAGNPATTSGTFSFNATTTATALLSATGSFHACDTNTGGGNCLPTATGSF
jgi:hypothetical protein